MTATPDRGAVAPSAPRPVDAVALARIAARLARAAGPPWLHREVAARMAGRLPAIRLQPTVIVDTAGRLGASDDVLARAYPRARRYLASEDGAAHSAPWWRRAFGAPAPAAAAPPAQLLWSNLQLQFEGDPLRTFAAWRGATADGGFLMFSTLGPGSLSALRDLYTAAGWGAAFAPFVDMHDLGDLLLAAGWAEPVMDQETLTLHWRDADALLAELRGLGGNADPRRHAGLRTPRWRNALHRRIGALAGADGRPALAFEVVYGHAFAAPPRPRRDAPTTWSVDAVRARLRDVARRG